MDKLSASCDDSLEYPRNIIHQSCYEFTLNSFHERLKADEHRIFHPEKKAAVDFLEFKDGGAGEAANVPVT